MDRDDIIRIGVGVGVVALLGFVGYKIYTSWLQQGGSGSGGTGYGALNVTRDPVSGEPVGKISTVPDPTTGRILLTPVQPSLITSKPCPDGYYKDLGDAMRAAGGGSGNWRFEIAPGTTDCLKVIKL